MGAFWTFLYYIVAFLAINSLFLAIPNIMPGVTSSDLLPYQVFFAALGILNITLKKNKSEIFTT